MGFRPLKELLGEDWDLSTFRDDLDRLGYSVVVEFDSLSVPRRLVEIMEEEQREFDWTGHTDISSHLDNRVQVVVLRFRDEADALWAKMILDT